MKTHRGHGFDGDAFPAKVTIQSRVDIDRFSVPCPNEEDLWLRLHHVDGGQVPRADGDYVLHVPKKREVIEGEDAAAHVDPVHIETVSVVGYDTRCAVILPRK